MYQTHMYFLIYFTISAADFKFGLNHYLDKSLDVQPLKYSTIKIVAGLNKNKLIPVFIIGIKAFNFLETFVKK